MTRSQSFAERDREFTVPECQRKPPYSAPCFLAFVAVHFSKNLVMLQSGVGKQACYLQYAEETPVSEASSCHSAQNITETITNQKLEC
jgi:hypothetical protein